MTRYLVLAHDGTREAKDRSARTVQQVVEAAAPFVGDVGPAEVTNLPFVDLVRWVGRRQGVVEAGRAEHVGLLQRDRWAVTGLQDAAAPLARSVSRTSDGSWSMRRPVWGTWSAVVGELHRPRLVAWQTYPALLGTYVGSSDGLVAVSDVALLAALALAEGDVRRVGLSEDFLTEYLALGHPVSPISPFTGVARVPSRRAVTVEAGVVREVDPPLPPGFGRERVAAGDQGDRLAAALRSAGARAAGPRGSTLVYLSGGKDSRVLLGSLPPESVGLAVTNGTGHDADSLLAARLAGELGIPHEVQVPRFAWDDVQHGTASALRASAGVPSSEPHQVLYGGPRAAAGLPVLAAGQWPLYKGAAKRPRYRPGSVAKVLEGRITPYADAAVHQRAVQAMEHWLGQDLSQATVATLFRYATDHRSGAWLQPTTIRWSGEASLSFPISDMEVTHVCESLDQADLMTNRPLFDALAQLLPIGVALPLDRGRWPFEETPDDPRTKRWEQRWAEERTWLEQALADAPPRTIDPPEDVQPAVLAQVAEGLGRHVPLSTMTDDLRDVVVALQASSSPHQAGQALGRGERVLKRALWRWHVAEVWWSRAWLDGATAGHPAAPALSLGRDQDGS